MSNILLTGTRVKEERTVRFREFKIESADNQIREDAFVEVRRSIGSGNVKNAYKTKGYRRKYTS